MDLLLLIYCKNQFLSSALEVWTGAVAVYAALQDRQDIEQSHTRVPRLEVLPLPVVLGYFHEINL